MAPPEAAESINEFTVKDRLASILKDPGVKHQIFQSVEAMTRSTKGASATPRARRICGRALKAWGNDLASATSNPSS